MTEPQFSIRGLIIAGTDTGVGKTVVACGLAAAAAYAGVSVGVIKPVESGCMEKAGRLIPADASILLEAAQSGQTLNDVCPYPLKAPLAPSVAAKLEGVSIDPNDIVKIVNEALFEFEFTLVEPAGGLLSPLADKLDSLELARLVGLPILLVAPNKLGVINHVRLCEKSIRSSGVLLWGIVLNQPSATPDESALTNREEIERFVKAPFVIELPYVSMTPEMSWPSRELMSPLIERLR